MGCLVHGWEERVGCGDEMEGAAVLGNHSPHEAQLCMKNEPRMPDLPIYEKLKTQIVGQKVILKC